MDRIMILNCFKHSKNHTGKTYSISIYSIGEYPYTIMCEFTFITFINIVLDNTDTALCFNLLKEWGGIMILNCTYIATAHNQSIQHTQIYSITDAITYSDIEIINQNHMFINILSNITDDSMSDFLYNKWTGQLDITMLINCKYNAIDFGNSNFYSFVCSISEHTYSENEYVGNNWMFELVCIETAEIIAHLNLYLWVSIGDGCNNDY